jgi:spoIIIJ-associated protein
MEWVETTGRDVAHAKESALDELGVDEQDAEFEVLAEARIGLFGRVRAEARVRARVRPTAPRAKDERRRKRKPRAGDDPDEGAGSASEASRVDHDSGAATTADAPLMGADDQPRRARSTASSSTGRRSRSAATADAPATVGRVSEPAETADVASLSASAAVAEPARPRRNRGGGGGSGNGSAGRRPSEDRSAHASSTAPAGLEGSEEGVQVEVALEEQAKVAMGLIAEITVKQDGEESVELSLEGQELGLLIGPKGATLLALQDLTRTVVQRKTSASNGRLWVDVSGYRQKRSAALARFAQQVAADVLASGNRKALEPMIAADRKVVHDTVTSIEGVATLSEGEDTNRRVVVYAVSD